MFHDVKIGAILASSLYLGRNDFLPKFQNVPHLRVVQTVPGNGALRQSLFVFHCNAQGDCIEAKIDLDQYLILMKILYCPKALDPDCLTYEEVRQFSISPRKNSARRTELLPFTFTRQADLKHPKLWLPPASCIRRLSSLPNAMLQYILGLAIHDAPLPHFTETCLVKKGEYSSAGPWN